MDNVIQVNLDSKKYGWGIGSKRTSDFLRNKNGDVLMFSSLVLAREYAAKRFLNPEKYDIYFVIKNDDNGVDGIHINYIQKVGNHYEFYSNYGKYVIYETVLNKVMRIGYYVFENGDTQRIEDRLAGKDKCKVNFKRIKKEFSDVMVDNHHEVISSINQTRPNEFVVNIVNSTVKLHICMNSRLMDINQVRKQHGERCLCFNKNMDKYLTIYYYATANEETMIGKSDYDLIDSLTETIIADLGTAKYVPVEFNGYIILDERMIYNEQ